jgi:hypothetical protein
MRPKTHGSHEIETCWPRKERNLMSKPAVLGRNQEILERAPDREVELASIIVDNRQPAFEVGEHVDTSWTHPETPGLRVVAGGREMRGIQ